MKLTRPRTTVDLRVGDSAIISVVLLVQQQDLTWFNQNDKRDDNDNDLVDEPVADPSSNNQSSKWSEVCQILQEQILPRILQDSIEDAHFQDPNSTLVDQSLPRPPSTIVQGGIALGHDPKQQQPTKKHTKKPRKKLTKKQLKLLEQQERQAHADSASATRASQRPFLWAMGPTLQLAYRSERVTESTATLVFHDNNNNTSNNNTTTNNNNQASSSSLRLRSLERLPFTLTVACGPKKQRQQSQQQQHAPLLLLQPELIPIAHLFRPPPTTESPSNKKKMSNSDSTEKPKKKRPRPKEVIELLDDDGS